MRHHVAAVLFATAFAASGASAESHNYSDFWGATNGATLNIVQTGETVTVTGFSTTSTACRPGSASAAR